MTRYMITMKLFSYLAAIPGLSGRVFKNAAKTGETVLFQRVGAQGLSIADSAF
jgi:hypothetical protein